MHPAPSSHLNLRFPCNSERHPEATALLTSVPGPWSQGLLRTTRAGKDQTSARQCTRQRAAGDALVRTAHSWEWQEAVLQDVVRGGALYAGQLLPPFLHGPNQAGSSSEKAGTVIPMGLLQGL